MAKPGGECIKFWPLKAGYKPHTYDQLGAAEASVRVTGKQVNPENTTLVTDRRFKRVRDLRIVRR